MGSPLARHELVAEAGQVGACPGWAHHLVLIRMCRDRGGERAVLQPGGERAPGGRQVESGGRRTGSSVGSAEVTRPSRKERSPSEVPATRYQWPALRTRPSGISGASGEAEDQQHETGGRRHGAGDVEGAAALRGTALADDLRGVQRDGRERGQFTVFWESWHPG